MITQNVAVLEKSLLIAQNSNSLVAESMSRDHYLSTAIH